MGNRNRNRNIRYLILLLILLAVAVNEALVKMRAASWEKPLRVHVYAINGDGRAATRDYIAALRLEHFSPVTGFMNREARRYGLVIDAITLDYQGELESRPPELPLSESMLGNIAWSLQFRAWALYWAFKEIDSADIDLFVNYYDPETTHALRHSVGLQGGMIGLINGFGHADYDGSNNTVIAHELMHTLGATDKYDAANMPQHPRGYAEPFGSPLYPQRKAEVMGGRIPIDANKAEMPRNLDEVVVGVFTAAEINWPTD